MKALRTTILLAMLALPCVGAGAETTWRDFDFKIKAGVNIGGSAPMGIPAEIRKIISFNPEISLSMQGEAVYWLTPDWGVQLSLRFENKAMSTKARVKEYAMLLRTEDGELSGFFTGEVVTRVKNGYMTVPITTCYRAMPTLNMRLGAYYALLLDPSFSGSASGGHFRTGDTGHEYNMEMSTETPAYYDFSNEISKHDVGVTAGAEWNAFRHLVVSLDLNWGLLSVFRSDFTGMKHDMYNVYANLAFGYHF